ncbi:MAG TPA: hypothetical protein VFT50_01300 [Baekduia sp.]|nr:hypothetical protein [Baekduia sp.]
MSDLERRLLDALPVDGDAEDDAWRLAHAAFVRRRPTGVRIATRARRPLVALAATACLVLVATMSSAGSVVVDLVGGRAEPTTGRGQHHQRVHVAVPPGGRLLVVSGGWASVLAHGSAPRRLAPADEATFSAFGRYVAVARGSRISVLALDGRRVWALQERHPVHTLRWSPDGLRLAYRTGGLLKIVDGNGERARTVSRATGRAVAWRPGPDAVLAYQRTAHAVALIDVATGRDVGRLRMAGVLRALTWSPDGARLVAIAPHELRWFDRALHVLSRRRPHGAARFVGAAFAPRGHRLAVLIARHGRTSLTAGGVRVAQGRGLRAVVWAPDGRRLLVPAGTLRFLPGLAVPGPAGAIAWRQATR